MCDKKQPKKQEVEKNSQKQQQPKTSNKARSTSYPFYLLTLDNEESNIVKGYN
ncbi:MAG: hypothetical protein HRT53_09005 [Colwellia sp.]|nr:hypothetical protein [Colwellia sp.]